MFVSQKSISFKSVDGSLSDLTPDPVSALSLPPADGARLQEVYDAESRYMRRMRTEGARALWYVWVPETSLSVSAREAARLGNISEFSGEPVAIRGTGGTVVPQGPGVINISVLSHHPQHPGIHETYAALCEALRVGFTALGLPTTIGARAGSFCDGDHNILHQGRKLVGTAQRWALAPNGAAVCLHHCAVLAGESPESLCTRTEALYDHARQPLRYDRDAHSDVVLDQAKLAEAMLKPLHAYLDQAAHNRI